MYVTVRCFNLSKPCCITMLHLCFLVSRFSHNSSERFTPTSPSQTIISSAIPQRLAYFIPQATHVSQFDLKKKFFFTVWNTSGIWQQFKPSTLLGLIWTYFYCTKYNWDWAHIQKLRRPQATNVSCVKDSGDFIIPIQNELQNLSIHLSGCQSIYSC